MGQRQGSGAVATAAVESGASLEAKAKQLIEEVVRPLIQVDGGQIELVSVTEARMVVRLGGRYLGCPGRPYALQLVERAARNCLVPDIQVATDDDR
jgi:Fe-S cluster biogenesis protein NfuA